MRRGRLSSRLRATFARKNTPVARRRVEQVVADVREEADLARARAHGAGVLRQHAPQGRREGDHRAPDRPARVARVAVVDELRAEVRPQAVGADDDVVAAGGVVRARAVRERERRPVDGRERAVALDLPAERDEALRERGPERAPAHVAHGVAVLLREAPRVARRVGERVLAARVRDLDVLGRRADLLERVAEIGVDGAQRGLPVRPQGQARARVAVEPADGREVSAGTRRALGCFERRETRVGAFSKTVTSAPTLRSPIPEARPPSPPPTTATRGGCSAAAVASIKIMVILALFRQRVSAARGHGATRAVHGWLAEGTSGAGGRR